jgi:hypothetical protein
MRLTIPYFIVYRLAIKRVRFEDKKSRHHAKDQHGTLIELSALANLVEDAREPISQLAVEKA